MHFAYVRSGTDQEVPPLETIPLEDVLPRHYLHKHESTKSKHAVDSGKADDMNSAQEEYDGSLISDAKLNTATDSTTGSDIQTTTDDNTDDATDSITDSATDSATVAPEYQDTQLTFHDRQHNIPVDIEQSDHLLVDDSAKPKKEDMLRNEQPEPHMEDIQNVVPVTMSALPAKQESGELPHMHMSALPDKQESGELPHMHMSALPDKQESGELPHMHIGRASWRRVENGTKHKPGDFFHTWDNKLAPEHKHAYVRGHGSKDTSDHKVVHGIDNHKTLEEPGQNNHVIEEKQTRQNSRMIEEGHILDSHVTEEGPGLDSHVTEEGPELDSHVSEDEVPTLDSHVAEDEGPRLDSHVAEDEGPRLDSQVAEDEGPRLDSHVTEEMHGTSSDPHLHIDPDTIIEQGHRVDDELSLPNQEGKEPEHDTLSPDYPHMNIGKTYWKEPRQANSKKHLPDDQHSIGIVDNLGDPSDDKVMLQYPDTAVVQANNPQDSNRQTPHNKDKADRAAYRAYPYEERLKEKFLSKTTLLKTRHHTKSGAVPLPVQVFTRKNLLIKLLRVPGGTGKSHKLILDMVMAAMKQEGHANKTKLIQVILY